MRMYYTFGTDPIFPFYGGYVIIEGPNEQECHRFFKKKWPFPGPDHSIINCSFFYSEERFTSNVAQYYTQQDCHGIFNTSGEIGPFDKNEKVINYLNQAFKILRADSSGYSNPKLESLIYNSIRALGGFR